MSPIKMLGLAVAVAAASPAWAGLVYSGTGSYNLGTPSSAGGTAASTTTCGFLQDGQDALTFTNSGANSIGIHAYACDNGGLDFGARASGQNTYYAQAVTTVSGVYSLSDVGTFSFFVNPGAVGAFGSTSFAADEFQKASLTIKLIIDGVTYIDDAWSAEVGTSGAVTNSHSSDGSLGVGWTSVGGAGYYSYGISGGPFDIDLDAGDHNISYVMTSTASGNITSTSVCTGVTNGGQIIATRSAEVVEAPNNPGEPFPAYCGAGAQSGDPLSPPIVTPFDGQVPEPMTAGLALTALLAAAGVRRRTSKR